MTRRQAVRTGLVDTSDASCSSDKQPTTFTAAAAAGVFDFVLVQPLRIILDTTGKYWSRIIMP